MAASGPAAAFAAELSSPSVSWSNETSSPAPELHAWLKQMQADFALLEQTERHALHDNFQIVRRKVEHRLAEIKRDELVSEGGGGSSSTTRKDSKVDRDRDERAEMEALRQRTQQTAEQMSATKDQLEKQAEKLSDMQTVFSEFDGSLDGAARAMMAFKAKSASDARYVWAAFYFFVAVCTHIVLRRLKVYWMIWMFLFYLVQPLVEAVLEVFGVAWDAGSTGMAGAQQRARIPKAHGSFGEL